MTEVPPQAAPPNAPPPAPSSAAPPAVHWSSGVEGLPPETSEWLGKSTYKTPAAALAGFHNLERLKGVPADRVVQLPAEDDAEGWKALHGKLGRPESPEGYTFEGYDPKAIPEGVVDLVPDMRTWAHEAGLSPKQAGHLYAKFGERMAALDTEAAAEFQRQSTADVAALKREWGSAYDTKVAAYKTAASSLGWDLDEFDAVERALGTRKFLERFAALGERLGEAPKLPGGVQPGSGLGGMTPASAAEKIGSLKKDPAFAARLGAKDPAAEREWKQLHEIAASAAA